jgi:hypothetical protein
MRPEIVEASKGSPIRLMFEDEARFGRITDPRRCWAPFPMRPVVACAVVREFTYQPSNNRVDVKLHTSLFRFGSMNGHDRVIFGPIADD